MHLHFINGVVPVVKSKLDPYYESADCACGAWHKNKARHMLTEYNLAYLERVKETTEILEIKILEEQYNADVEALQGSVCLAL